MRRAIQYSTVVRRLTGISYHRPPQVTVKVWLFPGELWYLYRPLERVFLTYIRPQSSQSLRSGRGIVQGDPIPTQGGSPQGYLLVVRFEVRCCFA